MFRRGKTLLDIPSHFEVLDLDKMGFQQMYKSKFFDSDEFWTHYAEWSPLTNTVIKSETNKLCGFWREDFVMLHL